MQSISRTMRLVLRGERHGFELGRGIPCAGPTFLALFFRHRCSVSSNEGVRDSTALAPPRRLLFDYMMPRIGSKVLRART